MNEVERREKFIKEAKEKFGDKFDYSKVIPFRNKEKDVVTIICPEHGEFQIHPRGFLKSPEGCPKCSRKQMGIRYQTEKNKVSKEKPSIKDLNIILEPKVVKKDKIIGTVYCFVNKQNGKLYFGETVKSDYRERFTEHRNKAFTENIINYFYNAIRKYGWENFDKYVIYQTEILEKTQENRKKLNDIVNEIEKDFIKKYSTTNHNIGYNLTDGGDGVLGYKFSEETRKKLSEARSGEKHWNYGNYNNSTSKPVLQFDLDFNFIKEWPSCAEVQRQLGINSNNISRCCDNKIDTYKNYIWVRKSDYYEGYLEKYKSRAKCKSNDKEVLQYDFSGKFVASYISAAEAGRQLNCNSSLIVKAASGKERQGKGFIWIYKNIFSEELLQEKIEIIKLSKIYKTWLKEQGEI